MAKILMVDDEPMILLAMGRFLVRQGLEIYTTTGGCEALAIGSRLHPEVLVVDWVLKNSLTGLDIAQALRLVNPNTQIILVTGYPMRELEAEAAKVEAFAVMEKPYTPTDMTSAVRRALAAESPPPSRHTVAVFELDATGSILYANMQAQDLMDATAAGKHATHFAACFAPGSRIDLDQATTEWIDAPSHTIPSGTWHLRSQSPNDTGGRLVVVTKHLPLPQTTAYLVDLLLDPSEGQST